MEFDYEQQLLKEAALKERVIECKRKIRKYPQNIRDITAATMIAEIVYNSEVIDADTLPEDEAIEFLLNDWDFNGISASVFKLK